MFNTGQVEVVKPIAKKEVVGEDDGEPLILSK